LPFPCMVPELLLFGFAWMEHPQREHMLVTDLIIALGSLFPGSVTGLSLKSPAAPPFFFFFLHHILWWHTCFEQVEGFFFFLPPKHSCYHHF
jgi:hypothetical protein